MEDPRETHRLAAKVDASAWAARFVAPLLGANSTVLDIGCGPGAIAAAVGQSPGVSEITALDQSAERAAEARRRLSSHSSAEVVEGVATELPFPANRFDVVYCRMLLQYLPDAQRAIQEMVRVCRPGGRVLLQDLDGQLVWHHPVDTELEAGVHRVLAAMAQMGFDPFVGRKLFEMANHAGLKHLNVGIEPYHLFAGAIDETNLRLWELKLDIILPTAATALGSESEAFALKQRFLDYLRRDDTLTYSVLFTVTGEKSR